jgi:hypothetical protein
MEVLLLGGRGGMLVFMRGEIERKLGRIGWIGTKAQTANRAGILAGPYAFAFPACHYRFEADFICDHTESLHRFQWHDRRKSFKTGRYRMRISVEFDHDIR